MSLPVQAELLDEIAAVAARIDALGWAEAGAGNLSLILDETALTRPVHGGEAYELGSAQFHLSLPKHRYLLITAKGRRMRDLATDPAMHLRLIGQGRDGPYLLREAASPVPPSSEVLCHLGGLLARGCEGALIHAHTDFVIALSMLSRLAEPDALERALTEHLPEIATFIPNGVQRLGPWEPGSEILAGVTASAMKRVDAVIWDHHGAMVGAPNLGEALDRMEMLEKAARIWWLAHRTGEDPQQLGARFSA